MVRVIVSALRCKRPRRCARWWPAAVLLAVVAFGCEQDSEHAVQVLGTAPGSTETAQPDPDNTPDGAFPTPTSSPESGDDSAGSAPESPPGPGDDGPSGPVGDTGSGETGGGPGIAPGEGDRPGGLRLLAPRPPYEGLADEIYDMCDDDDAYAVVVGRVLGPGDEITDEERHAIALDRVINEVSCDEPGGRRYVYMSDYGPGGPFATVQAATEDYNDRSVGYPESKITHPKDIPLGYFGDLDWDFPLEDIDEVRVVEDSVLVRDGTIRGLVRNLSKTLFAREVTVTARPAAGKEGVNNNAQAVSGRFPLTVQPGERAFFEIENWSGSSDLADFDLEVSASLSANVDITRAFGFGAGGTVTTRAVDEEFFKNFVPDFVYQNEKHKISDGRRFHIEFITVGLIAPTSHPSLKDQVLGQNIADLRVYMALIGNGKVHDIVEPPLFVSAVSAGHPHFYPQVVSLPTYYGGAPFTDFDIVFIPAYSWHLWVGEPGPLDYSPRTLPEAPPPTVDPDSLPQETPQPIE